MYTVFQKSDAKIQITITTAHLIRINYPHSNFNYHLSGTNVANFNKIHSRFLSNSFFKKWNVKQISILTAGSVTNNEEMLVTFL